MDATITAQLLLVAALVLLNAAFAGSELALISLREGQLRRLEQQSATGRVLARLARQPNQFLATIQVGITLAGFLASATAAVTLAQPLVEPLAFLGGGARPVAILLVTSVLTFVTLVFGELAPKRVAMQRAEGWSLVAARPLAWLGTAARPLIWLLSRSTDLVVRLVGGDPSREREAVTRQEIRDLLVANQLYTKEQRLIIEGALEVAERRLRQVLRPRTTVIALREDLPVAEAIRVLAHAGHTRAPVYRDSLDDADRIISLLSLVAGGPGEPGEPRKPGGPDKPPGEAGERTVRDHAMSALVFPEQKAVVASLRELQAVRQSMALVVDEHGAVEGIVTVEDLVEEVVGEIYDEHDRDVRRAVRHPDGSLTVVGRFPVHDLVDLHADLVLPMGDYVTIAGLLIDRMGRIPRAGDAIEVDGWHLRVDEAGRRGVKRVTIRRATPPAPADPDEDRDLGSAGR
jgi:putative hemolysin